ncbi:hypothetical protein QU38_01280, partial [Staphylococcus aureus]
RLEHLGPDAGKLQHLLVRHLPELAGPGHDARIGGVDTVHIGVDVAAIRVDRSRHCHRRGVRAATAERGDAVAAVIGDALETGDHRDLAARPALFQAGGVDRPDARLGMGGIGVDRHLRAQPGTRRHADRLERDCKQPRRDLL